MVALAVMALLTLGYAYFIAYRLDWVRYISEPHYWRLQTLTCPERNPQAVIVLSEEPDSKPRMTLNYDLELMRHLKSLPKERPVMVEIKRRGYLWEWNYGDYFVLAIEGQGISEYLRKLPDDLEGCSYEAAETLDPALLLMPYTPDAPPASP